MRRGRGKKQSEWEEDKEKKWSKKKRRREGTRRGRAVERTTNKGK